MSTHESSSAIAHEVRELEFQLSEAKAQHGKTLLLLNTAVFETIPGLESTVAELREQLAEKDKEILLLEESLAAQEKKYEDCPHPKGEEYWPCGCSYDKPSHVCMVHAPQLKKAVAEIDELREQNRKLREALLIVQTFAERELECRETSYLPEPFNDDEEFYLTEAQEAVEAIRAALETAK